MSTDQAASFATTITGIPLWLLQKYLVELGAKATGDGWLQGHGWEARLTQVTDYQIGSVRVGRVALELCGDPAVLDSVRRALEPKLIRGGG